MDIKYVTIYFVLTKPFFIFKSLINSLFTALQPILIKQKLADEKLFRKTVISFIQLPVILFLPVIFFLIFFLDHILLLWLGDEYTFSEFVLWGKIALLALVPRLLISIPNRVLLLTGITYPVKKAEYYFTGLNVVLSILITFFFHTIGGVIIGTLTQFTLGAFYFLALLNQYFNIKIKEVFSRLILGFVIIFIIVFVLAETFFKASSLSYLTLIMCFVFVVIVVVDLLLLKRLNLLRYLI
jgi:O-antigen/teichoic acid export membrane protein